MANIAVCGMTLFLIGCTAVVAYHIQWGLNRELVRYSDHGDLFDCQMVQNWFDRTARGIDLGCSGGVIGNSLGESG